jgi:hypothetical protein
MKGNSQLTQSKPTKKYKSLTIQIFTTKSESTLKNSNDNAIDHCQYTGRDEQLKQQSIHYKAISMAHTTKRNQYKYHSN